MKTMKILTMSLILVTLAFFSLTSCKKTKNISDPANTNSIQNLANDENQANAASDEAMADINTVLGLSLIHI